MRVTVWSARRLGRIAVMLVCAGAAIVLLMIPQAAQTGVRRGLAICGTLLIPSLFPFLVLSGFVIHSGFAASVGRRLAPLMERVFGFSGAAAMAMLMSLIGGYPAGAGAVAALCAQGEIEHEQARRLLRCCVSAGPAFVIGAVGVGMLGSAQIGVRLLLAHWTAYIMVALIERDTVIPRRPCGCVASGVGTALTQSVNAAAASLLSMCGFVLAASALLSLLDALVGSMLSPLWRCVTACIIEVSMGCTEAATMGRLSTFCIGAALGFGGLSVHGQIAATTAAYRLMDRAFFRARLLHGLLGGCLSFWFCRGCAPSGTAAQTMLSSFTAEDPTLGLTAVTAVMLMCVIYLYSLPEKQV